MSGASPIADEKRRLRGLFRATRRDLDEDARQAAARAILATALEMDEIRSAGALCGYVATDGEPDVAPILTSARQGGSLVLLPRRSSGGVLDLVAVAEGERLVLQGRETIPEPTGPPVELSTLPQPCVLLVPCVALDRSGYRLGRGGGHYDRLIPRLKQARWRVIGVCLAAQLVDRLPREAHDARVDAILTEAGSLRP